MSRSSRIASHIQNLPKSGIRDFFELVNSMDDVISLGVGEPDFATPWSIREAAIHALERGHTSYTSNLGLLSLRQEICTYVAEEFSADYDPVDETIITVGVSEAFDLAIRAITEPGDEIIFHEPCYVSYNPIIRMALGKPVPIQTLEKNNFALDPDDLVKAITPKTKAIILNFPCNPTGANITLEQKKHIAEIVVEKDLILITDEIYAELTYGERSQTIAALPGMLERTIFLHGFSKAYAMTGFRLGFACGPHDLIDAMMKIHQYTMLCAPINAQEAAIEALKNGKSDMLNMKEHYHQRRNVIVKRFNDMGLTCVMPEGAFYAYVNISSTGLNSEDFARQLLESQKVAVVPGTAFTSEGGENYIRCAYATSIETIEEAMRKIKIFLNSL
ncbi:MAG: aminotransferase class I/II-fold pyridoxal phosphate-dependent enzyme [Lentisphaeria bacterium]|nr:aminotransferase class I/II-fold pyridoxal phosphate-dependent enzyme [Lentisphaeria bacterium]NQZ67849.1 aminotransferase class I/II-fold pyridoxal phosphate-dependent enzyme [Lentisphaeria bacterium]